MMTLTMTNPHYKHTEAFDSGPLMRALALVNVLSKDNPTLPVEFHGNDGRNHYFALVPNTNMAFRVPDKEVVQLAPGAVIFAREDGYWNMGFLAAMEDQPNNGYKIVWLSFAEVERGEDGKLTWWIRHEKFRRLVSLSSTPMFGPKSFEANLDGRLPRTIELVGV